MNRYESRTVVESGNNAQMRMRKNFAILYAAAALAIAYEVLPWKKGATFKAISRCMSDAFRVLGSGTTEPTTTPASTTSIAQTVKNELGRLNLMKITKRKKLSAGDAELRNRADGFHFVNEIYVKPERWHAISDANRDELVRLKVLKTERNDVSTVARKLAGVKKKRRYHVICTAALESLLKSV